MKTDTLIKSYAFLARDISETLGTKVNDNEYQYISDNLKIIYFNKQVTVYYNEDIVLIFNYDKESYIEKYREGVWTQLLVDIHQNLYQNSLKLKKEL